MSVYGECRCGRGPAKYPDGNGGFFCSDCRDCVLCGGKGQLLVEEVITLDDLTPDEQPPYLSPCHECHPIPKEQSQ